MTQDVSPATSGFALSAAVVVLFNTLLACVKDADAPLKNFMRSLTGHDWITQGLADLILFVLLGLLFLKLRVAMDGTRLIAVLVGAVAIASVALGTWYALF